MNIELLQDLPERGRHWKKGLIVYGVDKTIFEKYIKEGKVKEFNGVEPIWSKEKKEEEE